MLVVPQKLFDEMERVWVTDGSAFLSAMGYGGSFTGDGRLPEDESILRMLGYVAQQRLDAVRDHTERAMRDAKEKAKA